MTILRQIKKEALHTHLNWINTLNFKELRKYENLSGPKHSLPVGSSEKDFFELFVTSDFYNKVGEETNKYAASSQRKAGAVDNNWEDTTQMRKKSKPILEF